MILNISDDQVTTEENKHINRIPNAGEIKKVIFASPSGMPALFYQIRWVLIGNDVVNFVQECFRTKRYPRNVNQTYIALIPKKHSNEVLTDYRLISLCNVNNKIVAKILANRSRLIMDKVISQLQGAFVPSR